MAGWSERLELTPWIAVLAVLVGTFLASLGLRALASHAIGLSSGLIVVTVLYATFLPNAGILQRVGTFVRRVTDWLGAAYSGAASTDNLLFAYSMALLAWLIGYVAGWSVGRTLTGWWAVVPTAAALLLNLSYSPPEHLPLIYVHLVASFALLLHVNWLGRTAHWREEDVEFGLQHGTPYAIANIGVAIAIVFLAWRMPVGQVSRGVAQAWENVAGPWQSVQNNFDRLFASLNPSPMASRGLTVAQTMAPRGSFELGDDPVMRVMGRDAAYWRAATYDRYTGRAMTTTQTTGERLERRQPLEGTMDADEARKFVEYSVTMLAASTSVIYAPDSPVTVSVPTVYEYRADRRDFALLRPMAPVHEQQRYSVLAAVTTASIAELRQAGSVYPDWTRKYRELPVELPDQVRRESWRVVGEATNAYDAAAAIEQYLRGMTYSTRVPVPPSNQDWVSFLLFNSREGYCDYFSTAMTVMLRGVGIPARVASGYVTGDWDPMTQSYLVTERHAHTWTEVYFPRFGWVPFEPSASRPLPPRVEAAPTPLSDEEWLRVMENDSVLDPYYEDEDLFDSGGVVVLPPAQTGPNYSIGTILLLVVAGALLIGLVTTIFLWFRGIGGLPLFARPYAQVVRLATWCGFGPARSHTPYEYAEALGRAVPAAAQPLATITEAYVAGRYGGKPTDSHGPIKAAGLEARKILLRSLAAGRVRGWLRDRIRELVARGETRSA